jgi:multiple sugar transport system permease protein
MDKNRRLKKGALLSGENRQGWLAVILPLVLLAVFDGYPMLQGIYESFTNWDGLFKNDFIGFHNYVKILTDSDFWKMLSNNFILLLFLPLQILIGLIVAVLLYEQIPGWRFYQSCYYLPQVTSALSIGYLFAILFGMDGPINSILKSIGLGNLAMNWLGSRWPALAVIMFCMVWINIGWQGIPGAVLLMRSSFVGIPNEVIESARIDGAGFFTILWKIVMPMGMAGIAIVIIFQFIGAWNDYLTPLLYLTTASKQTLMVVLSQMVTRYGGNPAKQFAGIFLSVIPTIVIYLCLQKYMLKGVTAGSLK